MDAATRTVRRKEGRMRVIDADALMEAINTWPKFGVDGCGRIVPWNEGYEPYIHLRDAVIAISALRQPERETGEWIPYTYVAPDDWYQDKEIRYHCSRCGAWTTNKSNFCPNCGAKMEV